MVMATGNSDDFPRPPSPAVSRGTRDSWLKTWRFGLFLVLLVFAAYQPVWRAGFIWDDDDHLTRNPCVVGPLGLKDIWTTPFARLYPLTISSFWLQHALWGLNPLPYHLVNVSLHAVCAVLLWRLLLRLEARAAWFGAALWALHPMQVESVAWITELKNTQSGVFYLLTILFFLKWKGASAEVVPRRRERDYALALLFAALAMASKPSTVVLPVVLGLCAWWTTGRWHWRDGLRLAPFLVLTVLVSADTIRWVWEAQVVESGTQYWTRTGSERVLMAGQVVWFYLGKLIWPHPLMFIYPRWEADATNVASYGAIVTVGALACLLWWHRQGRWRPVFFAFTYFLVVLLPVMGLVDQYFLRYSFVADHFQYLPSIGLVVLAVAAAHRWLPAPAARRTLGLVVLGVCSLLSWRHCHVFRDPETLWRDTLAKNPAAWLAHNNLGHHLFERGDLPAAIRHFKQALRLEPEHAQAHYNLGLALDQTGRSAEAVTHYEEALRIQPRYSQAHNNLGITHARAGRLSTALQHFQEAVRIQPNNAEAQFNLGATLVQTGHGHAAIASLQQAVRLNPRHAAAHYQLGLALEKSNRFAEAIPHLEQARRLDPQLGQNR